MNIHNCCACACARMTSLYPANFEFEIRNHLSRHKNIFLAHLYREISPEFGERSSSRLRALAMESITVEASNESPPQSTRPKSFFVPVVFEKEDSRVPAKGVCLVYTRTPYVCGSYACIRGYTLTHARDAPF